MALAPFEFIRRFLMHVLPKGFHRIRHYGLLANGARAANLTRLRELLRLPPVVAQPIQEAITDAQQQLPCPCPRCGGRLIIIETFAAEPTCSPAPTPTKIRIDTSSPATACLAQSWPSRVLVIYWRWHRMRGHLRHRDAQPSFCPNSRYRRPRKDHSRPNPARRAFAPSSWPPSPPSNPHSAR
jgi:hypothetical protein